MVCGAVFATMVTGPAVAEVHAVIGDKPPREMLNQDLLNLPERERSAWIHGAMAMTAQVLAAKDADMGRCVMAWYFEGGTGPEAVSSVISQYPEYPATAAIFTVVKRACSAS